MIKKVVLAIIIFFLSLLLIVVFIFYNFPYASVVRRIDSSLKNTYSIGFSAANIKYRFPFKLLVEDIRLEGEDSPFSIDVESLLLRIILIPTSKLKNVEIDGSGLRVKSTYVNLSEAHFNFVSRVKILKLLSGKSSAALNFLALSVDRVEVEKVFLSGFEFSSFKLSQGYISFLNQNETYIVEKGFIKSDIFNLEISGAVNVDSIDMRVMLKLSDKFFKSYANLKDIVGSISENGTIKLSIKGDMQRPTVRLESRAKT